MEVLAAQRLRQYASVRMAGIAQNVLMLTTNRVVVKQSTFERLNDERPVAILKETIRCELDKRE